MAADDQRAALAWELFRSWEDDEHHIEDRFAVGKVEHDAAEAERVAMRDRIEKAFGPEPDGG